MGGRSIEKLSTLLKFTLRSTTICPKVYPWPSTCRDLARGCIRLLLDQNGLRSYERIMLSLDRLIRLSLPCNDLLANIRNLSPSLQMGRFPIHNVLEWLKTFPQPPLDIIDCWQGCLEYLDECCQRSHPGTSDYPTFKEYEARWTEFQKQMASRCRQEIQLWDVRIVAQS
ncbi:hypothetical protein FB451DRAFT_1562526 [Mycena latifolia]|nr:hypothetical protein FB451DRAFT_1562526 [Mycena latifolia]